MRFSGDFLFLFYCLLFYNLSSGKRQLSEIFLSFFFLNGGDREETMRERAFLSLIFFCIGETGKEETMRREGGE